MSNFTISYAFVALDRFSETAAKINNEIKKIQGSLGNFNSVNQRTSMASRNVNKTILETGGAFAVMRPEALKAANHLMMVERGTVGLNLKIVNLSKGIQGLGERMAHLGDRHSMGSFYKFMNIGMPIFLVTKAGFAYSDALEGANIALSTQFGKTKQQVEIQKELNALAVKYQATTRISAAQFMGGAKTVANMTDNIGAALKAMPVLAEYAIATGQSKNMAAAAQQLIQGIVSGKIPGLNIKLTGATTVERFNQAIDILHKKLGGIVVKDSKTASAQLEMAGNNFSMIAGTLMQGLAPALSLTAHWMAKLSAVMVPFIKHHQTLVKVLGMAVLISLALVVVEMVFGAVMSILGISLTSVIKVVKGLIFVFNILRKAILLLDFSEMLNPAFLVAAAILLIIGAIGELYLHSKKFRAFIKGMVEDMKSLICFVERAVSAFDRLGQKIGLFRKGAPKSALSFNNFFGGGKGLQHKLDVNVNMHDPGRNVRSTHVASKGNASVKTHHYPLGFNMRTSLSDMM